MPEEGRSFAVVVGSDIRCPSSDPPPRDPLSFHPLHGRVVRQGDGDAAHMWIHYGGLDCLAARSSLLPVEGVSFAAGDRVLYKGEPARVRDVIWHHKDERANYYVEQRGRRVSKRLRDEDLEPLPGAG